MRRAVIILPTYNEAGTVEQVTKEIFNEAKKKPNWEIHLLVVDSKSQDKTEEIVRKLARLNNHLHLLSVEKEGLGKAYIQGFRYAMEKFNPFVLFEMDADLSHDPKELSNFLQAIEQGADFVVGSRYMKGGAIPQNWGFHRKFFSVFGNIIARLGFMKLSVTEWTNGYRAIKTWVIKDALDHIKNYSGYVFQIALLDFALKNNARIKEIPIKFTDRTYGKSKFNPVEYSIQSLWYIFSYSSFVKFVIVGFMGFALDFGYGLPARSGATLVARTFGTIRRRIRVRQGEFRR